MGPVLPVNFGSPAAMGHAAAAGCAGSDWIQRGVGASGAQGAVPASMTLLGAYGEVSQILQAVGQTELDEQMLRLLIALLILSALLEGGRTMDQGATAAAPQHGRRSEGGAQFFSVLASSSSIHLHETVTLNTGVDSQSVAPPADSPPSAPSGRIDISA